MATVAYDEVLKRAQRLSPADQLRLLEELAAPIRRQVATRGRRSILELQGLGKEIWQGLDAQEYVNQERTSVLSIGKACDFTGISRWELFELNQSAI